MAPRDRPPVAARALVAAATVAAGLVIVALSWSDRAPGLLSSAAGDDAHWLWDALNVRFGFLPEVDAVAHIVMWGGLTLLLSMITWTYLGAILSGGLAAIASVAVEYGQQRYSSGRIFEVTDMLANGVGIAAGVAAAFVLFVLGSVVAATARSLHQRHGPDPRLQAEI